VLSNYNLKIQTSYKPWANYIDNDDQHSGDVGLADKNFCYCWD
jgi:hypothetical protein